LVFQLDVFQEVSPPKFCTFHASVGHTNATIHPANLSALDLTDLTILDDQYKSLFTSFFRSKNIFLDTGY
jgi:hypothetical protein